MRLVKAYSCDGEGCPWINPEHVSAIESLGRDRQRVWLSGGYTVTVHGTLPDVARKLQAGASIGDRQTGRHPLGEPR